MKITRLSTAVIEANYDWTLVRIDAEGGKFGIGEAYMGPGLTAILRELAPLVVGQDPYRYEAIVRMLYSCCVHAAPGVCWHAIAGIETALLDLVGKLLQRPVSDLLGGRCRDRVRIYADCHAGESLDSLSPTLQPRTPSWMGKAEASAAASLASMKHHGWDPTQREFHSVDDYRTQAAKMRDRGFTAFKFDADIPTPYESDQYNRALSPAEIDYAVERLQAVRQEIGPHADLAVDCHWNYNVADAIRLARALEPLNLLWFEDPIPPDAIAGLAQVQESTSLPVATGENQYFASDFLRLLHEGKVRVLAPDAQKVGLLGIRHLGRLAESYAAPLALHNISGPIGTLAAAHISAVVPNVLAVEWHAASVPFFDQLLAGGEPLIAKGQIAMTDRPGWGFTLNEDVAYHYRKQGEPFFE
jgi:L-alanine-DL-glutamate epimerase-like enolase superfamily enzyme